MLRLRTLGGLSIERLDGPPLSVGATSARRRLTILAVLAAGGARAMPRDKLLALFWPESDTDRARHALDQTLYALKRDFKADDLFLGREELALNPNAIASDIGDFRAALARREHAAAVDLYGGPFLDGVFVSGAPDVERWIDEERVRVAHEVEGALESLATEAAERSDHRGAAQWWMRLAAMDPRKTRVVVALMSELAASGDRPGALRHAEMYRTLLRDDLDVEPNPAVTALADQLKRDPPASADRTAASPASPATPASAPDVPSPAPDPGAATAPLAGRYVIEREIGRGGAATVFLARDLRNQRPVALKMLRRELGTGVAADRFRQEINVTANLQHPHILAVHDWGEANGTLYFAMPFIEGESLRERLARETQLPVDEVVRLAREIAGALAYAHARGIVHRDVKPENVLLTSGHALVADFGLARALDMASRRTGPGVILGTPAYLSPEQASGRKESDQRSDQYSLACVLYEALAGEPPFISKNPIELLALRLEGTPSSLRSRRSDVPEHVDVAILRALSTDPANRFGDVTSFAHALEAEVVALPPQASQTVDDGRTSPAPGSARRALPPRWRSRRARMVGGVIATLVLGLAIAWRLSAKRTLAERSWILLADVENHTPDSIFNRALDAALVTGLQQSTYVNVFPRDRVEQTLARMERGSAGSDGRAGGARAGLTESMAREVAQREGIGAVVVVTVDQVDSSYLLSARLIDVKSGAPLAAERREAKRRSEVIEAIDELVRRLRRDIGESAAAIAKHDQPLPQATTRSLEALRKYADATAAFNAGERGIAVELWQGAIALDSDFALAHAELGAAYYAANNRPEGDLHYARALALLDRLTQRERLQIRASAERWRGNREIAIELGRALLAEYPNDPSAWGQIGYDYLRLDRYRDAIDALHRQLQRDSGTAPVYLNLATAYKGLSQFDDARQNYRRAFALQPAFLKVGNLNHEYGSALVLSGRLDDARAVYDTMLHGNTDQRAQGERSIGLLAMYTGGYGDAIQHFRQAAMLSHSPGRELTEARNRLFLASAEREVGWRDSARAELLTAHALFRRSYFEPRFLMFLGKALARNDQVALAREVLDSLGRRVKPTIAEDRIDEQVVAGEIALASGRADSAVRLFRQASAADPEPFIQESLARGLVQSGDVPAAAGLYDDLAEGRGGWYGVEAEQFGLSAPVDAGRLYERLGDTARARRDYERVLRQWPKGDSAALTLREARDRLAKLQMIRP